MYKRLDEIPPPPRRVVVSRTGQTIISVLAILTFLQVAMALATFFLRHYAPPLIFIVLEVAIWVTLIRVFYVKQADLLKNGIATTATITRVNQTRVSYSFSVNQIPYGGTVSVAATPGQLRPGLRVAVVYNAANPAQSIPVTAAALVEIAR